MEPNRLLMNPREMAAMTGGTPVATIIARKAE
jgi:hypothetical protein